MRKQKTSWHKLAAITERRKDFPMLSQKVNGKPLIYLDTAATAQKPDAVIRAISDFYTHEYSTVNRAIYHTAYTSTEKFNAVREKVRQLIHAERTEEIIFTRGTTAAINTVAYSYGKAFVKEGDEIIVTRMEHHSNIVPWQILCEDRKAHLKVVSFDEHGELDLNELEELLNERTRLVAVAHMSNTLGTINPIRRIAELVHQYDAHLLVDGAQAVPHMPVDVQALDADFYAFSGHKMMGPTGVGVLYGKLPLLEAMPPYQGGGDMIEEVHFERTTYAPLPLKFEAGTPMIAQVIGLGAAIDYLNGIGMESIKEWEHQLLLRATERLQNIEGLTILGTAQEKGALISFIVEGVHPLDIGTLLDLKGIAVRTGHQCAQPVHHHFNAPASTRASFAFYNTLEEIDLFADALEEVLQILLV